MLTMMTHVKLLDGTADGGFTDILQTSLNLEGGGCVLEERAPVDMKTYEQLVEKDALSEMLAEMSLSTLLYYVLAGEGKIEDEPA